MSKQCNTCKWLYYIGTTRFCGKSKATNRYCVTANPKDNCKKYEVSNDEQRIHR